MVMLDSKIDEVHESASCLCIFFLSPLVSLGSSDRSHNAKGSSGIVHVCAFGHISKRLIRKGQQRNSSRCVVEEKETYDAEAFEEVEADRKWRGY